MAFVANEYEDGPENIPIFQPEVWISIFSSALLLNGNTFFV